MKKNALKAAFVSYSDFRFPGYVMIFVSVQFTINVSSVDHEANHHYKVYILKASLQLAH